MDYARLGETDLVISRVGFGCEPLGGTDWGEVDGDLAIAAVSRALELGVNFFDTADIYGLGRSERVLSRALGAQRYGVVIATKFGHNWEEDLSGGRARTFFDSSPRRVVEALEDSLRRLRLDCIPLYQVHWPDPNTPIADTMEALLRCQEAGKIKHVGVSNFPASLIREANQVMVLASVQLPYNIIDRRAEQEVLPCCEELGIGVLAYGSLAQGFLTGKYGPDARFGKDDRRHRLPHFQREKLKENLRIVERLKIVGQHYHKSPAQVAIRWILEHPTVTCAITGAKSPVQIEDNVGALGWRLTERDRRYVAAGQSLHSVPSNSAEGGVA
jgi:aryl-alcohol dehydrogenase-like predicted oxidoreductase